MANVSHFVRSEDFIKYFMKYQGVNEDSVFIAEASGEITGLAVVALTTEIGGLKQGNIIELLSKDLSSMRALVKAAVSFCNAKNVDLIVLVPPPTLKTSEIFRDWIKSETNVMMTKILSLSSLLQALLSNEKVRTACSGTRVVFQVGQESIEARIGSEKAEVSKIKGEPKHARMLISASPQIFLRVVFGQLNPYVAYFTGRIRIRGVKDTRFLLKLLSMIQVTAPFYTSLADRL
jgi:putative sterol carrier protein